MPDDVAPTCFMGLVCSLALLSTMLLYVLFNALRPLWAIDRLALDAVHEAPRRRTSEGPRSRDSSPKPALSPIS